MPEALTHPTPQELAAFGVGRLGAAAAAAVAGHLETCLACRRALEGLPPDSFVGKLRSARPGGPSLSPAPASTPAPAAGTTGLMAGAVAPAPPAGLPAELAGHPKFRIERELGRGGMGVVYLARHVIMDRPVAVKVIHPGVVEQPQALERFHAEVQAAARLDHPNIVRAYDAERAGALHLLVMEFVEGTSLDKVLGRKGPLPIAFACRCVQHAALGLQHAHEQGMVHRDLKPSNLIASARHRQVKVLDFGLARLASERARGRNLTQANDFVGTPEYVAPEQALDARSADIRADIYSLGCTLYHLLAGRPPFHGDAAARLLLAHLEQEPLPLCQVRPDVPEGLSLAVGKMLAKDPARRYQTPAEVVRALRPFADADAQGGPRAKTPAPFREDWPGGTVGQAGETRFPPGVPQPGYVEESPLLPPPVRRPTRGMPEAPLPAPGGDPGAQEALPDEPPRWSDTGTGRRTWLPGVVAAGVSFALIGIFGLVLALSTGSQDTGRQPGRPSPPKPPLAKATLRVEVDQPGAEVFANGERMEANGAGGRSAEARLHPGRYRVAARKPGFREFAADVTLAVGETKVVPATLVRLPSQGTLRVEVDQSGADVFINGEKCPVAGPGGRSVQVKRDPGAYKVIVRKAGFKDFTQDVALGPGELKPLRVTLISLVAPAPPQGTLRVEVDQLGAEVFVNGEKVPAKGPDGKSFEAPRPPGRYKVEVKKPGFKAETHEVQLDKGDRKTVTVRLKVDKEPLAARQKRMLRWTMHFNTANGAEYLRQLQGLGAILAIPIREVPRPEYRIVRDLTPGREAKLLNEDFSKIQRIYWIDDNPRSVLQVMQALGHPELKPKRFVAFMPEELEKKLFQMEKDFVVNRLGQPYDEDRIFETHFRVVGAAGGFRPEITDVKLKPERVKAVEPAKPPLAPGKHMLRWRMGFNTDNGAVYLRQLAGLGATLAVPIVPKNPKLEDYRVIHLHLRGRRLQLDDEDISKIQRVYWVENDPKAVQGMMLALRARRLPLLEPSHFVIFPSETLEKQLFDMEKAYMEKELKVPYDKDRIAETHFRIVHVGGSYRPKIDRVRLKDRR